MKKMILKRMACFTAAVVLSNVLFTGNVLQAAGQQVQKVDEVTSIDTSESDKTAEGTAGNSKTEPENLGNPDQSQALQGTDTAEKPAGDAAEPENPAGTGDAAEPDNANGAGDTAEPENPTGTGDTAEPENPAGTGDTAEPENPKSPDQSEDSKESEQPVVPKLKKPVLKASSKPDGTIKLSWNRVSGAAEYVLLRSTKKDSGFHRIYAAKTNERVYKDQGRVLGKTYYYCLAVFSKGRASRADSKIAAGCSLEQVKLTEVSNISGSRKLVVKWNPVKGADSYEILRKNTITGAYQSAGTVNGSKTSYTDNGRDGGTIYSYKVYAKDASGGRGSYSKAMSQMAIDKNKKMIALTYDDGPSAYTPIVLNALEKYDAHATFFVVGSSVNRYADSIRRAVSLGCEIGNHTYDHSNLRNLSSGQVQSVIGRTNQAVKKQAGVDIQLLRPPYGSYSSATFAAAGMPVIMWSIDTLDWKTRSTSATIQCVQQKAYDGAVVLMHDLHQPTAQAADAVIKYLKSAGYQMVTVSELAAYRGGMRKDAAYSQFRK